LGTQFVDIKNSPLEKLSWMYRRVLKITAHLRLFHFFDFDGVGHFGGGISRGVVYKISPKKISPKISSREIFNSEIRSHHRANPARVFIFPVMVFYSDTLPTGDGF
jgi:hypothetical protein